MGHQAIAVPTHWKVLGTLDLTPINSRSCTLDSKRDTKMGHKSIDVPTQWKALGTLEWETKH